MATNPYAKYLTAPAPTGDPVIARDPFKINAEQRAQEDQVREEQRWRAQQQREDVRDARAAEKDAAGTESERTAGFLTGRIVDAVGRMGGAIRKDRAAQAPTFGVEAVRRVAGESAANYLTDAERQQARAAELDILDAALTLGTGAAYTREQLEGYRTSYFPQLGDDPATISSKRDALRSLLQNARTKAGKSAPNVDSAIATLDALNRPQDGSRLGTEMGAAMSAPIAQDPHAAYDDQGNVVGLSGSVTDDSPAPGGPTTPPTGPVDGNSSIGQQLAAGLGDVIEGGFNNTAGIVVNPIGRTIYEMTGYGGREYNGGQILRDALGLPEGDQRISPITEAATGGLAMAGAARAAAQYAPGVVGNALASMGSTPIRDTGAAASSVLAGQGVAALGGGPMAQTAAQVAGGALGYAAPNALSAVRGMGGGGRPPPDLNMDVIAAGRRQNVPVRLPDASPSARNRMAVAEAAPYSGPAVKRAMDADRDVLIERVRGQGGGTPMTEDYTLGQRTQGVGNRYIERTRQQKNAKYSDAERLAEGQRIKPAEAIAEVDRNLAQLEAQGANNNAATIAYLKGLREDLAKPEGFSITEFQGLRSGARKKIKGDQALTVSDADRRLDTVVKAFNADAKEQLPPQASDALQNADYFYGQRQEFINTVLRPFMGSRGKPMTPEQAGKALRGMTAGRANHDNLKRFFAEANPEEVADFRSTIAEGLVTGPKGEVGAAALASNIAKVPENIRTLVFGKEGAAALRDIKLLAAEKGNTTSGLNNSKSGVVGAAGKIGLRGLLTGGLGFGAGGPMGAIALPLATEIAASLGQARTARLLLNPDFTKWLRQTPNTTKASVIDNHFKRLGEIAARSPVIANDAKALQQTLLEAFRVSPSRAAAEADEVQERRREPPQ